MKRTALILVGLLLIIITYYAYTRSEYTKVVEVIDGDTIIVESGKHIRILEVDTPEVGQPQAQEATNYTTKLLLGKIIRLNCWKKDTYNRNLCWVYLGDRNVSQLIRQAGYSVYIKPY